MGFLPSGTPSVNSSAPSAQATTSGLAASTVPGAPLPAATRLRSTLTFFHSRSKKAAGQGFIPRIRLCSAPAGRSNSKRASSLVKGGAWVAFS